MMSAAHLRVSRCNTLINNDQPETKQLVYTKCTAIVMALLLNQSFNHHSHALRPLRHGILGVPHLTKSTGRVNMLAANIAGALSR